MRILHTADWHLGARLGGHDRTEELFTQASTVLRLAEEHRVDVLLLAGDLFDHRSQPALTKQLADLLRPHVQRGLHLVLVPGNHDIRDHFSMMHALLTLEHGHRGRIHVVQSREIFQIDGVQFAAIPYPTAEKLVPLRSDVTGTTARNVTLSSAYADLVRGVMDQVAPTLPTVFVAHITVAGVTTPTDRELTYDDDIRLGTADLPIAGNLAYIALGHIHQLQQLSHPVPCYYSGSIDRLNLGERNDQKGLLLVDIPPHGPAEVTQLPLEATPFYDLQVSAADLDTLPERYADLHRAFVRIEIDCESGADPIALQRRAHELCPRCLEVRFTGAGLGPVPGSIPTRARDYRTTVLDYLHEVFGADSAYPELERRTQDLIQEVSHAVAAD